MSHESNAGEELMAGQGQESSKAPRPSQLRAPHLGPCPRTGIRPKPLQQPRVPIMVGGNGPNVTWRLAARYADELNLDGLSPADQKLIAQAAEDSVAEQRKLWKAFDEKSMSELVAHGTVIIKPDKAPFQKAVQPVYTKYPEYKELISQIQAVK